MSQQSIIGQGTFIRGNVSGQGSLEIQGRIEGNVSMTGDVFIQPGALIKGNVTANQLSVAGSVAGNLTANEGLALEPGARVIGDLVGASIGIAEGALVRGLVRTADESPLVAPKPQAVPAVKASPAAQRPAMAGFGRGTPAVAARPAPATFAQPRPVVAPAPLPKPQPVVVAPPPPPSVPPQSLLPVEPESDELEAINDDHKYDMEDAEYAANGEDLAELSSSEKASEEPERRDGPPPPVAPALKKGQKAKKKGR